MSDSPSAPSRLLSVLRPLLGLSSTSNMSFLPCSFDDLKKRDGPPLQAWGLYGDNDLGRVNLITPDAVKRGRDAVQHGIAVNLNLPLTNFPTIHQGRGCVTHEILAYGTHCDDKVTFNTQCSTQWDGFRHVPYWNQPEKGKHTYHGGLTPEEAGDPENHRFSTGAFAKHPITTRAHLVDIASWLEKTGKPGLKALNTSTPITFDMLQGCIADTGIKFAPGEVMIVRSGFTEQFLAISDEERKGFDPLKGATGVEATEEFMRWVWDTGLAAVAGDTFAFECWPPNPAKGLSIHEVFLGGWGIPIGELFDLRELSKKCKELNQYTFFLTTMALGVDAGIGTPANAQAIL